MLWYLAKEMFVLIIILFHVLFIPFGLEIEKKMYKSILFS